MTVQNIRPGSKRTKRQMGVTIFLGILCIFFLLPFIILLSVSFSSEKDILLHGYSVLPQHFSTESYEYLFKNATGIIQAYKVTIITSFVTMIGAVLLDALIAYPLSLKRMTGKKWISLYLYFTMLFSGGLVPTYILIAKYLNLCDTYLVYILPALISPWYIFMMRTSFAAIPDGLLEAAKIDGANEYTVFFRIVLPLSKPVLATVALFTFLTKWNDWNTSMLYINDENMISLQYLLQRIMENITMLQNSERDLSGYMSVSDIPSETVRMAMAVVVAGPALLVFPFFQKYFVKGLTVGSVKG